VIMADIWMRLRARLQRTSSPASAEGSNDESE
jgi:hypothetical protein